ncbi:ABC transporter permease [Planosporangium thailandense]|uniref:ABC transporter permease n=1 Tax=Planosporangium thailandense TaxID=765197 RepID=A0ABX0Y6I5_9ACTN|nr:ABC transporter permease [Planosporangium thailandense]NJC72924.1 ABC transporter permease [Planosporangium thailandense]
MTASPATSAAVAPRVATRRVRYSARQKFLRSTSGLIGTLVFLVLVVIAIAAPLIAPDSPLKRAGDALQQPNAHHWFGTDELGRDLFSRVIYGTRLSLETAVGAAALSCVVGLPVGIVTGYLGGWVDAVIMRVTDFVLAVPEILFALVVVATLGSGVFKLTLAIGIGATPAFIRLARASTLSLRDTEYVLAARSMGAAKRDIMFRTVMPNILPPIFVQIVVTASVAILVAAALSFVGLGTPPPAPSWGGMLQTSRSYLYQQVWYAILPGVALAITVGALDAIGRGLQQALGTETATKASGAMG